MKNLTEGEKMVWAAVYALCTVDEAPARALEYAHFSIVELRRSEFFQNSSSDEIETAKEVLK